MTRTLTSVALTALVLLAGCSAEQPDGDAGPAVGAPSVSPLTGLPLDGEGLTHPVVTVKVDNSPRSRPQMGVGAADMVVEELVEGGFTRLAASFYTDVPERVGPVRSMRTTDIGIVKPLGGVLVASGGAPQTVLRVADAGIATVTEEAEGFYRQPGRPAPYNLFLELARVVSTLEATAAPGPYLPFGPEPLPAGEPATSFRITFSSRSTTAFEQRGDRYVPVDSQMPADDLYAADTVLALEVQVRDAGYADPSGAFVPESRFDGRGHATIFHAGQVVGADWIKNGLGAPVLLVQDDRELSIPPGHVWIALVPSEDGSVAVTG